MTKMLFLHTEMSGYFLSCLRELEQQGVEVHIVQWPVNPEAPFRFDYPDTFHRYRRNDLDDSELVNLAKQIDPVLICATGWMDNGYLQVAAAFKDIVPTIMMMDNQWKGSIRQWVGTLASKKLLHTRFSHAWVPGDPQHTFARKLGFAPEQILGNLYSCDFTHFSEYYTKALPLKEESFPNRFLYVGRYVDFKGVEDLWEAFVGLEVDWELWCAGTGPLVDKFPDDSRIRDVGFVQPEEMDKLITACGVFVFPSRVEPWGVALHEMTAAGMPVICSSEVGAASRFLEEGKNGTSFQAGSVTALTEAMNHMAEQTDEALLEMGAHSSLLAGKVTPEAWAKILVNLEMTNR
jgi:glycosyltransferase involved in cell wall biosynthesis